MNQQIKILAVDREEIILKSIRKALKSDDAINYDIITCTTALEGLKLIRSDKFSLVLTDLVLPGMNTSEFFRRIKNIDPNVPVIIMSGFPPVGIRSGREGDFQEEALTQAAGFLLKPFTTEEIKSLVLRVLSLN
jgi:DNA-binding NtrC family response regulator